MQKSDGGENPQVTVAEIDKAWLAGIIDGEGCLKISRGTPTKKASSQPSISLSNTCPIMREKVSVILSGLGVGHYIRRYEPRRGVRKPAWDVSIYGFKRIIKLLVALMPYLVSRNEEALLLYEFCQSRLTGYCKRRAYSERESEIIELLRNIKLHRHLREHTPRPIMGKMCSEPYGDMGRSTEMIGPVREETRRRYFQRLYWRELRKRQKLEKLISSE